MAATNTKIIDSENPSSLTDTEGLVSISQAAKILGISIDTVRRWDKQGILKSTRPDGKNRYFSVKELEDVKFSQPLSISEVSEQLNVSPSTLRRLEAKGLIKPERNSADERVYDRKSLESFLQSQYFVRQKEFQEEVLEPLNGESKSESNGDKGKKTSHHDPATHALLGEHHVSIAQLKKFRQIFIKSVTIIAAVFVIIIALLTLFFFLFPESASKNLGYYKKDPLGKHFIFQPQRSLFARQMKPFSQTSLRIVEAINPDLRKKVAPFGAIEDVNDVFQPDADGNVKSLYTFTVPDTSYLKIPDQGLVTNLNSQFVQGRVPGCEKGNIAIVGQCNGGGVVTLSGSGGGGTVITGSGDISSVLAGTGLSGGGSTGDVTLNLNLASGGGLETTTSGLSLSRTCANDQILKWNGSSWNCSVDNGGSGGGSITIKESDNTPTISPASILQFTSGPFTVSDLGSGTAQVALTVQANKGLETDTNGVSLIDCSTNQVLKYTVGNTWVCATDATGGGGGGSSVWSDLTDPTANLSLNHGEFTSGFNWNTSNAVSGNFDAFTLSVINDGASDPNTQRLLVLKNENNGIVDPGSVKTEALLRLEHNDDSTLQKGIEIVGTVSPNGFIETAIDVSSGPIQTALNVGANQIVGTTPDIDFTNFDLFGSLGIIRLQNLATYTGSDQVTLSSGGGGQLILDSNGGQVLFANNDTFNIGGISLQPYNAISNSTVANSGFVTDDNDLYVEGGFEVDGNINLGGNLTILGTTVSASSVTVFDCTDCLNYDDFSDSLVVDATTTTTLGANSLIYSLSSAGNFQVDLATGGDLLVRDGSTTFATFADDGSITFTPTAGSDFVVNQAAGTNVQLTATASPVVDQLVVTNSGFGTNTNSVDSFQATIFTTTGAGTNNSAMHAIIGNAPADGADLINGLEVTGIANNTTGTQNLIRVTPATSGNTAGTLVGVQVDSITTPNTASEIGIRIGSGWDANLQFADASAIVQVLNTGSITIEDDAGNDIFVLQDISNSANHILTGDVDTGLQISGATTDITTAAGENLTLESGSTGSIIIGNDPSDETVQLGTGAGNKTVQIGSLNGTSGTTIQAGSNNITLNAQSGAGNIIFGDTDTFAIGGVASGLAYNAIANTGGTANSGLITDDNDLFVQGGLEIDGDANFGNNITVVNTIISNNIAIGGVASGLAYNAIANTGGTASSVDITDDNDLYVQGALEVDGNFNLGGNLTILGTTLTASSLTTFDCSDCIDWDDIKDAMTLDAATTTTRTSTGNENSLVFNYINNGGTAGTDNYVSIVNAISSNTLGDLTTEALLLIDQADTVTTGNSAVENGLLITNSGGSTLTNAITIGAGSQAIATGINLASTGITTDIKLQNSETIDNDTDNQIRMVYGSTGGSLLLQNGSNLVTDQTTFNLLNTAATTINFGGTATTALNIGSTTTGVNNFAADTDWTLIGTENITITNSSASTDQLSVSSTGVTTNNIDGLAVTLGTSTGAGSNNSAIHAIIGNAPVDASDIMNGLEVTGFTQSVASTTQNLARLTSGSGSNTSGILNALKIDNVVTAGGASTETAINIGTGWDRDINFDSPSTILRLGATDNTATWTINDSCVSSCANAGTANNNLLQLRDLSTNFGAAVTSGAFISRNSYFGDEFNLFRPSCSLTVSVTGQARGDYGSPGSAACVGSSGELAVSSTATGAGATCSISSNNQVNGFETISAITGALSTSSRCLEMMTTDATGVTNYNIYDADNLPVMTMKVRTNGFNSANDNKRFYAGMGDLNLTTTAVSPANGVFFTNCQNIGTTPSNCRDTLYAAAISSEVGGASTTVSCGTISANNWMYLRIEVRANNDVHYFVDFNVADGIIETECGAGITTENNIPDTGITINFHVGAEAASNTTTLDIDYFRSWQDDNIQSETGLSGDNSTDVAISTQQITPTDAQNRLTAYTLEDGSWVLGDSLGNQLAGVDIMGNATFKGEVTASGLNINGDDGSSVASIDKSGTATLSAVDTRQVKADQVVAADIGQRYFTNEENLENGDVVMLDPSATTKVKKADIPNARGLVGVVTTGPSLLVDSQGTGTSIVVAAAGQVAVKVSTENGNINAGDMLTSSRIPGVAMKSTGNGPVIGRATMSYNGEGVSSILVLVDNGVGIKDLTPDLNALSSRLDSLEQKFQTSSTGTQTNGQDIDLSNLSVGALTVNLDMIIRGAMVVDGPATFKEAVRFEKDAIFDGNVAVNGSITVNNNSAGYAKIAAGEQRIQIIFGKPHANIPVITVSLGDGKFTTYSYRNVSNSGFEIMLKDIATEDLTFSWTATPVNNPQTFVNSAISP